MGRRKEEEEVEEERRGGDRLRGSSRGSKTDREGMDGEEQSEGRSVEMLPVAVQEEKENDK